MTGIMAKVWFSVPHMCFPLVIIFFFLGLYFTSNFGYAKKYADHCVTNKRTLNEIFVVALTVPGNSFPVTEHPFINGRSKNPAGYCGNGVRGGYQSHYTIGLSFTIISTF